MKNTNSHNTGSKSDTFGIYQHKCNDEYMKHLMALYMAKGNDHPPAERTAYTLVYTAPLSPDETLDGIYCAFNFDHPADFKGRSLSAGDVVVLNRDGKATAYYVALKGFSELPNFLELLE